MQKGLRLRSLDVLRGFTIAAMVLVNNPGDSSFVHPPLRHADWNGWTLADLVFPCFLFVMGTAMALSFARRGQRRGLTGFRQILRRGLILLGVCNTPLRVRPALPGATPAKSVPS